MVIVINSVIGGFDWKDLVWLAASTVRLQVSDYGQLSDYTVRLLHSTEWLVKNKTATAPITFEEIVMVMINVITEQFFRLLQFRTFIAQLSKDL